MGSFYKIQLVSVFLQKYSVPFNKGVPVFFNVIISHELNDEYKITKFLYLTNVHLVVLTLNYTKLCKNPARLSFWIGEECKIKLVPALFKFNKMSPALHLFKRYGVGVVICVNIEYCHYMSLISVHKSAHKFEILL